MLNFSDATISDLGWIFKLFVQSANKGHFRMTNDNVGRENIKHNLKSAIVQKEIVDFALPADVLIFESDKKKIGYVVVCDTPPALEGKEIYIFVIDNEFRKNGYGTSMLAMILDRWLVTHDIYARCFPVSLAMTSMLLKSGFNHLGRNNDGADVYRIKKCNSLQK